MQSQRKNSGSYFTRQQSTLIHAPKCNSSSRKRFSVATQTENVPNLGKPWRLCNFYSMSVDEIKENYTSTLMFLNCCHDFINTVFGEDFSTFENSRLNETFGFRVPEVPNYFSVLEMFLEKTRLQTDGQNLNAMAVKRKLCEIDVRDVKIGEEQINFDLQQFLPKNIGDGPASPKNQRGVLQKCGAENVINQSMFKNGGNLRPDNGIKHFGAKKRSSTSPSRLVKSEKDIPKRPSRHELKALSTTFEEILKTCNEFEKKSTEQLFKKDAPLEFYQVPREKAGNLVLEKYEQGDQENQRKKQQAINEDKKCRETTPDSKKIPRHNFNLIEYALKNLRVSDYDSDSPPSSPKGRAPRLRQDKVDMIPSQSLLTENLPNVLLNFQDISTNKKPYTVLNEAQQSQIPKKVNEMFQKMSKENLRSSDKAEGASDFNDSDTFIKFIENDNFSDEYGREYSSKEFIKNCKCGERSDVKMASSSDSIIWTDEEFERKNRSNFLVWSKEEVSANNERRSNSGKNAKDRGLESTEKPLKSHPLKLTDKDRSVADQKMLQAIGLFTEKGDFRPGVISILEEKQRTSFTQNSQKNVQFRTERKFDVKVHYNSNTKKEEKKESLSGKSLTEQQSGSNSSLHSSAVTFSSSTVSDSDLLSMEPNSDKTVIKKF